MNDVLLSHSIDTNNFILRSLPPNEAAEIAHYLKRIEMAHGEVLFEPDEEIKYLYFPSDAMISVVATGDGRQTAECGVIGWEGVGGVEALMGPSVSINRHVIQLGGEGHRIDAGVAQRHFSRGGELQRLIFGFVRGLMMEMSQTALCNRVHSAEQRLAKWLLMCRDRARDDTMRITQEFAAVMLGSNRVSVTQAAQALQASGLIKYSRGKMTILDRHGLEDFSCECYGRMREEFDRLTGNDRRR